MTTSELLPCFFLLTAAGAKGSIRDIHDQNTSEWVLRQGFSKDEENLLFRMLYMKHDAPDAKQLRKSILFQIIRYQNAKIDAFKKKNSSQIARGDYLPKLTLLEQVQVGEEKEPGRFIFLRIYSPYILP